MFAGRVQPPSLSKVRSAMFCAAGEAQDAKQESVYGKNKWDEAPLCVDELCVFMVDVPVLPQPPHPQLNAGAVNLRMCGWVNWEK